MARHRTTERRTARPIVSRRATKSTQLEVPVSQRDAPGHTEGSDDAFRRRQAGKGRASGRSPIVNTFVAPGVALPETFPPASDPQRNQYVREVAEGGMGIVSAAFDALLLRRFARKTMHKHVAEAPELAARFIEEAQITAQLDHPGIVPVHDLGIGAEDGKLYFTMKLVDGETLSTVFDWLHAEPFSGTSLEQVLRVFLKICEAVSFAHSRGVIHRDLKPDNVMVGSHGQVYVMDWGIALLLPEDAARGNAPRVSVATRRAPEAGSAVGTFTYMAPEQAHGRVAEQGPATDVYGLGGILYALLTGDGPHAAPTQSQALALARAGKVAPPETRPAWPSLPPGLCAIAMKALAPSPADRYRSVDELKSDVEEFLRGGGWFQIQTFEAGTEIVRNGAPSDSAYILTQGRCEVFRVLDGERQVLRVLGPGEIFGEVGLLTGRPRLASVVALERVRAMVITPEALDRELDRTSWLRILVEALASRFRELDQERVTMRPKRR